MKKITAQDWLDLMVIVSGPRWHLAGVHGYAIRDFRNRCPICSLAHEVSLGQFTLSLDALKAAKETFGTTSGVQDVVYAADKPQHHLRAKLMQALGMMR